MVEFPAGDWLTVAEVAAVLDVTPRRVQRLVKDGRIPARRVGVQFFVRRADAEAFRPNNPGRPKKQPPPAPPPARKPMGK